MVHDPLTDGELNGLVGHWTYVISREKHTLSRATATKKALEELRELRELRTAPWRIFGEKRHDTGRDQEGPDKQGNKDNEPALGLDPGRRLNGTGPTAGGHAQRREGQHGLGQCSGCAVAVNNEMTPRDLKILVIVTTVIVGFGVLCAALDMWLK